MNKELRDNNEAGTEEIVIGPSLAERLEEFLNQQEYAQGRTPLNEWLDGSDVMRQLNISARTLQTWRSNGMVGYSLVGGKVYYKKAEIERLLDNCYSQPKGKEGNNGKQ